MARVTIIPAVKHGDPGSLLTARKKTNPDRLPTSMKHKRPGLGPKETKPKGTR